MKKYLIKVNEKHYEVEVTEIRPEGGKPQPSSRPVAANKPASTASTATCKESAPTQGGRKVTAPMPGNILKIMVNVGDSVSKGQPLLVFEAMKMENDLTSPADGVVAEIKAVAGKTMTAGETLIIIN